MSETGPSSPKSQEPAPSEKGDLASFPAPPPLPNKRARARREAAIPPPPPPPAHRPDASARPAEPLNFEPDDPVEASAQTTYDDTGERTNPVAPPLPGPPSLPSERLTQNQSQIPPPAPPPLRKPPGRGRTSRRPWHHYGVPILVLLGIAAAVFFLRDDFTKPAEETASAQQEQDVAKTPDETVKTDLVGGGQLLVDARPWGEVTFLVDSEGRAVELPLARQTPLVLDLDPARYTVFLTHPELLGKSVPCEVEVSAENGVLCRPDLLQVTSRHYWEEIGWWQ